MPDTATRRIPYVGSVHDEAEIEAVIEAAEAYLQEFAL